MADELTGRFPYQSSDLLTQATIKNSDPLPAYHDPQGTEDADKGVPFGMIQADPVAKCTTAAGTPDKVATVSNFRDFVLYNGRKVTVYMQNENGAAATNPTLNVNSTGKFPIRLENQASSVTIGGGCWGAGTLHVFQYVEVDETTKYWLMVGHNVASVTSQYSVLSDGTNVYNTNSVDSGLAECKKKSNFTTIWGTTSSVINEYIEIAKLPTDRGNYVLLGYTLVLSSNSYLYSYKNVTVIVDSNNVVKVAVGSNDVTNCRIFLRFEVA